MIVESIEKILIPAQSSNPAAVQNHLLDLGIFRRKARREQRDVMPALPQKLCDEFRVLFRSSTGGIGMENHEGNSHWPGLCRCIKRLQFVAARTCHCKPAAQSTSQPSKKISSFRVPSAKSPR